MFWALAPDNGLTVAPAASWGRAMVPGDHRWEPRRASWSEWSIGHWCSQFLGAQATPRSADPGRMTSPLSVGVTYLNNQAVTGRIPGPPGPSPRKSGFATSLCAPHSTVRGGYRRAQRSIPSTTSGRKSSNTDWNSDAQAACQKFTNRQTTSASSSTTAFGTVGGLPRLSANNHGVLDITVQGEGDDVSSSRATLHANPSGMTVDRHLRRGN